MKKYAVLAFITYLIGCFSSFFVKIDFTYSVNNRDKIELFYSNFSTNNKPKILNKIILNNLNVLLINIIWVFTFGFLTFFNTSFNGFTLVYILRCVGKAYTTDVLLFKILPHSIELIGLLISTTIAYYFSIQLFKFCFIPLNQSKINFSKIVYLAITSIFLTIVAGFIEVYVSLS